MTRFSVYYCQAVVWMYRRRDDDDGVRGLTSASGPNSHSSVTQGFRNCIMHFTDR
jgi:hypothetical protein